MLRLRPSCARPSVRVLCALVLGSVLMLLSARASAQSCAAGSDSAVSQYGVTVTFDQSYTCGLFANGDYWVAPASPGGTVTIVTMTPDFTGSAHGWEVNPASTQNQGFDARVSGFDAARVPTLPYAAAGGQSIVKAVSIDPAIVDAEAYLDTAIVLTVLDAPPPGDGSTLFRPPYFGTDKPLIDLSTLHPERLPTLPAAGTPVTLAWVTQRYARVQLDHLNNWVGRAMHPVQNMPNYGSDIGRDSGDAVLQLMLDDPAADKLPALIPFVEFGIDLYAMMQGGQDWAANGGHHNGRKLALDFAAVLLSDPAMLAAVTARNDGTFGEDGSIVFSTTAGRVLWGQPGSESDYWHNQTDQSGSRTIVDPYGLIDGGEQPSGSYQFCCNSEMWKGTALALYLMPALRCAWSNDHFLDYVDRWVEQGAWTQPDTCAPTDGTWANYGITFGEDGNGGCIADTEPTCSAAEIAQGASDPCIGRWPGMHGAAADDGYYASDFASAMWTAERPGVSPTPPDCSGSGGQGAGGQGAGGVGAGGAGGSGAAGAGATGPVNGASEEDTGCGCRLGGRTDSSPASGLTLLVGLALALGSRRRGPTRTAT